MSGVKGRDQELARMIRLAVEAGLDDYFAKLLSRLSDAIHGVDDPFSDEPPALRGKT